MNAPEATTPKAITIEELLAEIRQAADDGDYIFRGESSKEYDNYPKVTSALYRVYQAEIDAKYFDIEVVEKAIVDEIRERTHEKEDDVILEQLQHYGGKTNQIDFSTDYLIALFFACYGRYEEDGRLILLNEEGVKTHKPASPQNRVIAQKSIFVRSPNGFVEPDNEVTVPSKLKKDVLKYLNKYHNINTATIYNDIHGYISQKPIHQDAYTFFYRGLTHQEKGEFDESIEAYKKAIELNPNHADTYMNRGGSYASKGDYDLAIADLDKAIDLDKDIELDPNLAMAYSNRGTIYFSKGEHDLAIIDLDKAIELDPNLAMAYSNRGNAYVGKGDYDNAFVDFNKSIELAPNLAMVYNNRGNAYVGKGEHDLAIIDLDKAIELDPNLAMAYCNRGTAYVGKGEHDLAIIDLDKAIELDPNLALAYCNRGAAYLDKCDYDLAIIDLDKAIELDPNLALAYSNRGASYLGKGDHDLAIIDLDKAIELDPNLAIAYSNRGASYLDKCDYDLAIIDLDKSIELDPNLALAYGNRGMSKKALGDDQGAKENFEIASRLNEQQKNKNIVILTKQVIAIIPADSDS